MQSKDLYNAMFRRMSVRKYAPAPLSYEEVAQISRIPQEIPPLVDNAPVAIDILAPTQVTRAIKGPHYAVAYSGEDKLSIIHAGYQLAYLDLALFNRGIGTCYNGMAGTHPDYKQCNGMPMHMVMVFGIPQLQAKRTGPSAFDRKDISEITEGDVPLFISEAVRVAPSSMNIQPWFLAGSKDTVDIYYSPRGILARLMQTGAYISMGIALCHLRLAAENQGFACQFDFDCPSPAVNYKKREFICQVKLK